MTQVFRVLAVLAAVTASQALADPPDLKTPSPVIYLADNLDEKDRLGFCLDTVGRGLSDRMHVHSCKPQGGDVQFRMDAETGHIASVAFAGLCADLSSTDATTVEFRLLTCSDAPLQKFSYDASSGEIRPVADPSHCLAAGEASASAGPFMSRKLVLAPCSELPTDLKRWVVKES